MSTIILRCDKESREIFEALRATIERLTKELEEARLQDPNQWRREYWKHYNDLKARADSLTAELAKAREALTKARWHILGHSFGSQETVGRIIGAIDAALPASPESQPGRQITGHSERGD